MFGDPEDVVDGADAAAAEAAVVADDPAAEEGDKPKKVTIPLEEYEALQRKARDRAAAERTDRGSTTDARPAEASKMQDRIAAREDRLTRLRIAAKAGNEDAQVLVDTLETVQESEQRQLFRMEMRDVPEAQRTQVRELMEQTRLTSPYAAYKLLRADRADELEVENRTLREQVTKKDVPRPKVEGTKMPSVTARAATKDAPKDIPYDEWIEGMKDPDTRKALKSRKAAGAKIVMGAETRRR